MTPDPTTTTPADGPARPPVPHRRASTLLGLLPALVLLCGATLLVASWWDELPDPIATRWGPDGRDGFGDAATSLTLLVLTFAALAVAMWLLAVLRDRDAVHRRIAVGATTAGHSPVTPARAPRRPGPRRRPAAPAGGRSARRARPGGGTRAVSGPPPRRSGRPAGSVEDVNDLDAGSSSARTARPHGTLVLRKSPL